jgi:hypothetical protein
MSKNRITFTDDFVLRDEKIGIGTTNPTETLSVLGTVRFGGTSQDPSFYVANTGYVGFGTTNPTETLSVFGNILSTETIFATVFTSLSDRTQKTDIRPIENALDLVNKMKGVKYKWKDNHNQPSIGVIAQDIEKVLPEVVTTNKNGLKSVSYGNIVGVLIEAIKEQQVRIEELERKLNA